MSVFLSFSYAWSSSLFSSSFFTPLLFPLPYFSPLLVLSSSLHSYNLSSFSRTLRLASLIFPSYPFPLVSLFLLLAPPPPQSRVSITPRMSVLFPTFFLILSFHLLPLTFTHHLHYLPSFSALPQPTSKFYCPNPPLPTPTPTLYPPSPTFTYHPHPPFTPPPSPPSKLFCPNPPFTSPSPSPSPPTLFFLLKVYEETSAIFRGQ